MTNDLDTMQARCDAATKEPWRHVDPEDGESAIKDAEDYTVFNRYINWPFIAHARQDVPNLIAEVRELRKLLEDKALD